MPDVRIDYRVGREEVEEARKELQKLQKATGINVEQADKMNERYKKLEEQARETTGEIKGFKGQLSGINEGLDRTGGVAATAASKIGSLTAAFKALLSNPIVLTIAAITGAIIAMTKAFLQSQKGMDTVAREQARLNAMWQVARDRLNNYTDSLNKSSKEIGGWSKVLVGIIFSLGEFIPGLRSLSFEMLVAGENAAEATDAMGDLELTISNNSVTLAENARRIQELLIVTRDMTKSRQEQRDALAEANKLELETLKIQEEEMEQRVALTRQLLEDHIPTNEELIHLNELLVEQQNLRTASLARQREILNRVNEQENRFSAEDKARRQEKLTLMQQELLLQQQLIKQETDDMMRLLMARIDNELLTAQTAEERFNAKMAKLTQQYLAEQAAAEGNDTRLLALEQEFLNGMLELNLEFSDELLAIQRSAVDSELIIAKAKKDSLLQLREEELQGTARILQAFIGMAAQSAELAKISLIFEKAAAIAQVIIDMSRNISMIPQQILIPGFYGSPMSVPNPALPAGIAGAKIRAATQIAAIAATTIPEWKSINSKTFHEGGHVKGPSDEVSATLQTGEFVMQRNAVNKYGLPVLEALNDMRPSNMAVASAINETRITNFDELKVQQFTIDEDGLHRYLASRGSRVEYLNKRNF